MYQLAYGVQNESYFMLKDWLEFEHKEIFEGSRNFRWRVKGDATGTLEMFPINLNFFLSTAIRL